MSKYICLCGMDFKKEKDAEMHCVLLNNIDSLQIHKFFKKSARYRFLDWFFSSYGMRFIRLIGFLMIYSVILNHFKIDFSLLESSLIGIGIGLCT